MHLAVEQVQFFQISRRHTDAPLALRHVYKHRVNQRQAGAFTSHRKRPVIPSITHKFGLDRESEADVRQSRETAPHHHVARRRVVGTCQGAAEFGDRLKIVRDRLGLRAA